jgi:hypothetical protein
MEIKHIIIMSTNESISTSYGYFSFTNKNFSSLTPIFESFDLNAKYGMGTFRFQNEWPLCSSGLVAMIVTNHHVSLLWFDSRHDNGVCGFAKRKCKRS